MQDKPTYQALRHASRSGLTGSYAHANNLTLERLPNGSHAWLRPNSDAGEPDDALYVVTDLGRRAVAAAALFDPSPTVADVVASRPAR